MTELKTLKDIIQTPKEDAQANILVNQLKQEAIKHVKRQQVPKSYKEIQFFWHCKSCSSGQMEIGVSKSVSQKRI